MFISAWDKKKKISTRANVIVLLFLIIVMVVSGCSSTSPLVGEWERTSTSTENGIKTWEFYKDGSFKSNAAGFTTYSTWEVKEAGLILGGSIYSDEIYDYEIDGETLTLIRENGVYQMKRVK